MKGLYPEICLTGKVTAGDGIPFGLLDAFNLTQVAFQCGYTKGRALFEKFGNKFCRLAPSNHADEISLLCLCFCGSGTGLESAIDGKSKGNNSNAVLGLLELRVGGQPSAKNNLIEIQT